MIKIMILNDYYYNYHYYYYCSDLNEQRSR